MGFWGIARRAFLSLLVVSAVPLGAGGASQSPFEREGILAEMAFEMPGPGWQRLETPLEPGQVPSYISIRNSGNLHQLTIRMEPWDVPASLRGVSPEEIAAREFATAQDQMLARPEQGWRDFQRSDHMVAGRRLPALTARALSETVALDTLVVLLFPDDFADRQRAYSLVWLDIHPKDEAARPLTEFDALVTSFRVRPVGDILVADDFDRPDMGVLPGTPIDVARSLRGYVDGEYMIQKVETETDMVYVVGPNGALRNTSASVDARLLSADDAANIYLYCRRVTSPSTHGYRLGVDPGRGRFRIVRIDMGENVVLVDWRDSPAIAQGTATNHLELTCAGRTITASANGVDLSSLEDSTYDQGLIAIGAGGAPRATGEARFDNLLITQR